MTRAVDLVCFSHLRWGFVFQRPNHLMTRAARARRTFFVEEPREDAPEGSRSLEVQRIEPSLFVVVPHVPPGISAEEQIRLQRLLLEELFRTHDVHPEVLWYYSPMALPFTRELRAPLVVYDCMDELSAFSGAPPQLRGLEAELFRSADIVFTGGHRLYQSKRRLHPRVHPFPSSVDAPHFARARTRIPDPADQAAIPHPRLGFFGVIDERFDLDLVARVAAERPSWHWVLLGPVTKIDPGSLPRRANLHWLGPKSYGLLPDYLSGWDVATMPFALNASTEFISPTKTLEYMAAGKPVVSTAIADVVEPYGNAAAVRIADRYTFVSAVEDALRRDPAEVLRASDLWVDRTSWDKTWAQMQDLLQQALNARRNPSERTKKSCSTT